jgi:integrase
MSSRAPTVKDRSTRTATATPPMSGVTKPNGRRGRKYVYGKDRDTVHEKWIKLHNQAAQGPIATRVPKLGEYLNYWLEEVIKPNRAPLTYATYETFCRRYITPGLGSKRLDKLQVRDVQAWVNRLPRTCQCCAQDKDARRPDGQRRCCALPKPCAATISPRPVPSKDIRGCLRSALSQALREQWVTTNVAKLVTLPAVRRRRGKASTSEEARRFLESARRDDHYLYAAYVLILVLGLRKGETLGLTWDDVDLDAGELSVDLQSQRVGRRLLHRETKTEGSDATLPLPEICAAALKLRKPLRRLPQKRPG